MSPNALGATPTSVYRILSPSSSSTGTPTTQQRHLTSRSRKPASAPSDLCWTSTLPLFFAATSNPLSPHFQPQSQLQSASTSTIYFELTPLHYFTEQSTVAIGLVSKPYPPHRQPGWHRASIGVHSDDGNRYINDSWGGRAFTSPFRARETVGLGIVFAPTPAATAARTTQTQSDREVRSALPPCKATVYLTRNGAVTGSWDVDEERDAEHDEGVAGLRGEADLYAAVGVFGDVDVEVRFFAQGDGFVPPPV